MSLSASCPAAIRALKAVAHLHSPIAGVRWPELVEFSSDRRLSRLHAAILRDDVKEDSNGCIALPDGVTWPEMSSSVLFVRSLYEPLWNDALEQGQGAVRGAAILGTPGSESRVPSHVQALWCGTLTAAAPYAPQAVHHILALALVPLQSPSPRLGCTSSSAR